MNIDGILTRFDELNIWRQGGQRVPHKPLLVLYALGRWQQGINVVTYAEAEPALTALLREFGPPRRSDHPEQPFRRLQRDGVWTVTAPAKLPLKKATTSHDVRAGFAADVQAALTADPTLVARIAVQLLERHFPESLHQDVLNAVGLTLEKTAKKKRDPAFRQRVLTAYEYRCAVCGFDVRLGSVSIALDAAHIRWHQAGGPDVENNGLALCVLHHKTFDIGAFTVTDGVLLVSDLANGTDGFYESLMAYHGKPIRSAQRPEWNPVHEHLEWHGHEVFKGTARHAELRAKRDALNADSHRESPHTRNVDKLPLRQSGYPRCHLARDQPWVRFSPFYPHGNIPDLARIINCNRAM